VRRLPLALGAILLVGVPVTLAGAQTSVPTVAVTAANGNIMLEPSAQRASPSAAEANLTWPRSAPV